MKKVWNIVLRDMGLLLVFSLVFRVLNPIMANAQTTNAKLSFSPPSQTLTGSGKTGTINAYLTPNGESVSSVELVITYNPNITKVTSVTPGAFFNSSAGSPIEIVKNIDNTAGRIYYAVGFPLGSGVSSSSTNSVAVINFTTGTGGTSTFSYVISGSPSTKVSNLQARNVLGSTVNGTVTVSGATPTVTPRVTNTPTPRPSSTVTPRPTNTPTVKPSTPTPTLKLTATPTPPVGGKAVMGFTPVSQNVNGTGKTGQVSAYLTTNGESVASVQLAIKFNPTIIKVDDVVPGAFFTGSNSGSPVEVYKNIDNVNGKVLYAIGFPLGSNYSSAVSNAVANIKFTTLAKGTSALSYIINESFSTQATDLNAKNVLGNVTTGSVNVITAITPTPTRSLTPTVTPVGTMTFDAVEDSYVSSSYPNYIHGKRKLIQVSDWDKNYRTAYLKFHTGNINFSKAVLKLRVELERKVDKKLFVTTNDWHEETLNYKNRPKLGSEIGRFTQTTRKLQVGEIITIPVDARRLKPDADGNISIAIDNINDRYYSLEFSSKEGKLAPQLVVNPGTGSPTPTITDGGPTPTPSDGVYTQPACISTGFTDKDKDESDEDDFYRGVNSVETWKNLSIPTQTGIFSAGFDVTPMDYTNSYVGYSNGAANDFSDLTAIVRFTPDGKITVRSGDYYVTQFGSVYYKPGVTYHFRMLVDLNTRKYSVWVSAPGLSEKQIAKDAWFRFENKKVSQINNIAFFARNPNKGITVCSFIVVPGNVLISISPTISGQVTSTPIPTLTGVISATITTVPTASVTPPNEVTPTGNFGSPTPTTYVPTTTGIPTVTVAPTATNIPTVTTAPTPTPVPCSPTNGDADGDGDADFDDYTIWLANYNNPTNLGPSAGDFNCSGFVDGVDYVIWLNASGGNVSATPTQRPTATPIPVSTATSTPTPRLTNTPTPAGTNLKLLPATQTLSRNSNGTLNVQVDPVAKQVSSMELVIKFDPSIIRVNDITPGAFFTDPGIGSPTVIFKSINNTTGIIDLAVGFPLGSNYSSTAVKNAAIISFTALNSGVANVSFILNGTGSVTTVSDLNAVNVLRTTYPATVTVQ